MSLPAHRKSGLDSVVLPRRALKVAVLSRREQRPQVTDPQGVALEQLSAKEQASVLFDQACLLSGWSNDAIAAAISEAHGPITADMVRKFRRQQDREIPNYAQIVALGPEFIHLLGKVQSKQYGFGRNALLDLVEGLGAVADALSE